MLSEKHLSLACSVSPNTVVPVEGASQGAGSWWAVQMGVGSHGVGHQPGGGGGTEETKLLEALGRRGCVYRKLHHAWKRLGGIFTEAGSGSGISQGFGIFTLSLSMFSKFCFLNMRLFHS